jgi:ADP-ribosyl-[dinitrogen reductase] hydrolase
VTEEIAVDTVNTVNRRRRLRNALWGLFIGDALAMPAHWYYSLENIRRDFHGGIRGYADPPHPHPESFMVGMTYEPDVETAKRLGRAYDILHEHVRYYKTSYSTLEIQSTEREEEHGNLVPRLKERFHYHHGLKAGENTLGAHLTRVLMRSVIRCSRYDPDAFLEDYVDHLTNPGKNRDPYTEIYLRRWFENYSRGLPRHACAELQRNVWSISAHGGLIRPMVISTLAPSAYQGLGLAIEHQNLTHRSENVAGALGVLVPLLHDLLVGSDPHKTISAYASRIRLPRVTGDGLFAAYRNAGGPGNIPRREMWKLHTALSDAPFEVDRLVREYSEEKVIKHLLANACYPEHGLPLLLYLARRNNVDLEGSLLANANAGGDNVHRGMVLGLIAGASNDELPDTLKKGLIAFEDLRMEIDAFADIALSGKGI